MSSQAVRSIQPGHISTVSVGRFPNHGHEPHGLCVCPQPLDVDGWGMCQRCHRPVPTSVRVR